MKAFLFSVCALVLLIGVILLNAAYVKRVTNELCGELQNLPECTKADAFAQALLERWETEEKRLELTVSATDMNDVENHLTALCLAVRLDDEKAFEQARALCLLGLSRIRDLERFRFLHIL